MNIVIAGGGDEGVTIAKRIVAEDHSVTVIEKNELIVNKLRNELDALIIQGDIVDISCLSEANIQTASLFIAVSGDDNSNIVSAQLARKMNNKNLIIAAKIENSGYYFDDVITPSDFGIDFVIDPKKLAINKIVELIDYPEAIEKINYADNRVELIGVNISDKFKFLNIPLKALSLVDVEFNKIRFVAVYRSENVAIPRGDDCILPGDKVYIVGKTESVRSVVAKYFSSGITVTDAVIVGSNSKAKELALRLKSEKRKVTMIVDDKNTAEMFAKELDNILILNGSATDNSILSEVKMNKSCFICVSDDDEYNIISAVTAKKHNVSKTISLIRNIELISVINLMHHIDSVFSPHRLSVGEVLRYCRKGNIMSIFSFSEINAETIHIQINEDIPILNKPFKEVRFPENMLVGVIIRGDDVIIPTGENKIMMGDRVVLFLLPSAVKEAEKIFTVSKRWKNK